MTDADLQAIRDRVTTPCPADMIDDLTARADRVALLAEVDRLAKVNTLLHRIADKAYAVFKDASPMEEAFNPYAYAVGEEEVEELRKEYIVAGELLASLGLNLEQDATNIIGEYHKYFEQQQSEIDRLKAGRLTPDELQAICHHLSEADARAFKTGCEEHQRKLFGTGAVEEERQRCLRVVESVYFTGGAIIDARYRQVCEAVKDEIARKIREGK